MWGLVEYHRATGDSATLNAASRAGELLLRHRLVRSTKTSEVILPERLHIHWPHYSHYDFFQGLRAVALLGRASDSRAAEGFELLRSKRRSDGTWRADGRRYWRRRAASNLEAVDWGNAQPIVTAAALVMLQ